jgi:hypothetical protein
MDWAEIGKGALAIIFWGSVFLGWRWKRQADMDEWIRTHPAVYSNPEMQDETDPETERMRAIYTELAWEHDAMADDAGIDRLKPPKR